MDTLMERIIRNNQQYQDWTADDYVLLAVSGGADSMAMLELFTQLPADCRPKMAVLHVHHHLRPEADLDCQLVEAYCQNRQITCYVKHWDSALHPKSNIEAAAREFRYTFFAEKMQELQANLLLTAHHADDQMETILMRLTRGSTLQGYAGIQRKRSFANGYIVRPFLAVDKEDLYTYCQERKVAYREDETNQELTYTRNRFRQQIIPLIKEENKQASRHFQEFSQALIELLDIAQPVMHNVFTQCFSQETGYWKLSLEKFRAENNNKQRMTLSYFLVNYWQREGGSAQKRHVDDLMELIYSPAPQATLHLIGGEVRKRYNWLYFYPQAAVEHLEKNKLDIEIELIQNGWLELPFNGKIGLFSTVGKAMDIPLRRFSAFWLQEADFQPPLLLRSWRSGDRIQLNSQAPFTKKISRIFIDQKVPQEDRQRALVVVDQTGKILWVPGLIASRWLRPVKEPFMMETKNEQQSYLLVYGRKDY